MGASKLRRARMKGLHRDERGLSILELVIVILLTGIITTAITTSFFQVFNLNARTANHMMAVSQAQQAGKLVSEDVLEAQDIDPHPAGGEFLILGWTAPNSTAVHNVTYTLEYGELWRSESVDGGDPEMTRVAEYINAVETDCAWDEDNMYKILIFTVTATVGQESEQRIYRIRPRPGT
jgi:type II secretory pathway pseudopilin PulG